MRTDWPAGFLTEAAAEGNAPVWLLCLEIDGVETYLSDRAYPVFLDPIPPPLPWVAGWGGLTDTPGSPALIYQQVVSMREMRISLLNTAESDWLAGKLVAGQQASLYLGFQATHPGHAPPSPALIDTLHVSTPLQYSSGSVAVDVTLVSSLTQLDVPIGVKDVNSDYRYPIAVGRVQVQPRPWGVWPFATLISALQLGETRARCDRDLVVAGFNPAGGQVIIDFISYDYSSLIDSNTTFQLTAAVNRLHVDGSGVALQFYDYLWGITTNEVTDNVLIGGGQYSFATFFWPADPARPMQAVIETNVGSHPIRLPYNEVEARVGRSNTLANLGPDDMELETFALPPFRETRLTEQGEIIAEDGGAYILLTAVRMRTGDLRTLIPSDALNINGTATAVFRLHREGFNFGRADVRLGRVGSIHVPPLGEDGWVEYTVTQPINNRDDLHSTANYIDYLISATVPPEFTAAQHVSLTVEVSWEEVSPGFPRCEYALDNVWAAVTAKTETDPTQYSSHNPADAIEKIVLQGIVSIAWTAYTAARDSWTALGYMVQGVIQGTMTIRQAVEAILSQSHGVMYTANGDAHLAVRSYPVVAARVLTDHDVAQTGITVQQSNVSDIYNRIIVRYAVDFSTGSYTESVQVDDVVSQGIYGVRPIVVDAYLIRSAVHAQGLADYMLETLASTSSVVTVRGYLDQVDIEISDNVGLQSAWSATDALGTVVRTTITPGQVGRVTRVAVDKIVY